MVNLYDTCTQDYCHTAQTKEFGYQVDWCGVSPCDCLCHDKDEIIRLLREDIKKLDKLVRKG